MAPASVGAIFLRPRRQKKSASPTPQTARNLADNCRESARARLTRRNGGT